MFSHTDWESNKLYFSGVGQVYDTGILPNGIGDFTATLNCLLITKAEAASIAGWLRNQTTFASLALARGPSSACHWCRTARWIRMTGMEREMESLEQDFKAIEANYTENMMSLTLARGYIKRLLENNRVLRHWREHHADLLTEFEAIAAAETV